VRRNRKRENKQGCLHISSKITHKLGEGTDSDRISKAVCISQARPLTGCEKEEAVTGSARQSVYLKEDHLRPVRRNRQ
jgi:hypothetical protein